ncbi:hypothetical protein SLNWT_1315 [Streptomyces albus]|uniref:Uncharacterized protein n=1 Tax=Streptomyces albus (strain ATCC 21838 / DSM 41398 / FERM P-419 / JCM 4703 / NBRC 107858) TaxID=1081613 RepID=A0A0B5ESI1_STRA4|nr:hypothetical protein SLNWT_1315 [Streptomyces albus]AOU76007.1 hypothetical protein SLNHY_1316 [Streptomyces albus]AYN31807.1 hypothetical protein DUI70_1304 [Streptomyces albus]
MTSAIPVGDAYPYLRAASAGIRHHSRTLTPRPDHPATAADRAHLDVLHSHLTSLHQLLDQLTETTRPPHPAAGRQLATAHTRLWQATAAVHDAFDLLPVANEPGTECHPERLPEGPPVLTICQRHLAASHVVRRKTTPADLSAPAPGGTTTCAQ